MLLINFFIVMFPDHLSPRWLKVLKVKHFVTWNRKTFDNNASMSLMYARVMSEDLGLTTRRVYQSPISELTKLTRKANGL